MFVINVLLVVLVDDDGVVDDGVVVVDGVVLDLDCFLVFFNDVYYICHLNKHCILIYPFKKV